MRRIILIFTVLLFCILNLSAKEKEYPENLGKKIKTNDIRDGDTFKIRDSKFMVVMRLYAIDTPEISNTNDVWAKRAKDELISLLDKKNVNINIIRTASHGRYTAIVNTGKSNIVFVNEEMVKRGLAVVAEKYCKEKDLKKYLQLQTQASNNQVGFWSDKQYYPEIQKMIDKYKVKAKQPAVKK